MTGFPSWRIRKSLMGRSNRAAKWTCRSGFQPLTVLLPTMVYSSSSRTEDHTHWNRRVWSRSIITKEESQAGYVNRSTPLRDAAVSSARVP